MFSPDFRFQLTVEEKKELVTNCDRFQLLKHSNINPQALYLNICIVLVNLISTDNYILFSFTKATWDGETKIIGISAFGNVFRWKDLDKLKTRI